MIRKVLVANRGEIARRVFATCTRLGLATVAVYSDVDAGAPHVGDADEAVRLPGDTPSQTYLRADALVAAALAAGADAVHPGYGFLSENADFARLVEAAGLTWVGPPADAIAAMGSKVEAKALLAKAGVPMLPSWTDPADVTEFPVLVKASAGGGGRGMRIVRDPADLAEAVAAAQREAESAFGDGTVFCERYVETGRHIEVQVLADQHGTTLALGERECSIQRRHQKIVEESPSPAVGEELRAALSQAAVAAAEAVGYVGAGTVEFLLAPDGTFAFLEMNTRLQVEHPVTEAVFGLDLVALQLWVAQGDRLPWNRTPPMRGHAIEVRLYAEDPARGWLPSTGVLHRFEVPAGAAFEPAFEPTFEAAAGGIRLDSGVVDGSTVSVHYDPMLAKVIAVAPSRTVAARALAGTLRRARLHGVMTNRDLLVRVLDSDEFLAGGTDTAFLDRHPEVFAPLLSTVDEAGLAAALAAATEAGVGDLPSGWRNVISAPQRVDFVGPDGPVPVEYRLDRTGALVTPSDVELVRATADEVVLRTAGVDRRWRVHTVPGTTYVDSYAGSVTLRHLDRFPVPEPVRAQGSLLAPMPGTVGQVRVVVGDRVAARAVLLTLEAMKLEQSVLAPAAGVVTELSVRPGDQVDAGAVLAVVTPENEDEE
jgi:propionyl-CoA carboxylase alpha chain